MIAFGRFQTFVLVAAYFPESEYIDNIPLQEDHPIYDKYAILSSICSISISS